jgi:hypothetical protein
MKNMFRFVACAGLVALVAGCSVGMAMSGEEQKDTSVVFPGSPRAVIIAKLGPPETSTKDEEGRYTDSYYVIQGNAPSSGRAVAHAGMDLLTLGIWEVVGTPLEMGAGRENRSRLIIQYDEDDEVAEVQQINVGKKSEATKGD